MRDKPLLDLGLADNPVGSIDLLMPSIDLGTFFVESLIVHEVPERRVHRESDPPLLSERLSPLNDELRRFFREAAIRTLSGIQAFEVAVDEAASSPVPGLVRTLLSSPSADMVEASRTMAEHLYRSQTGVNNRGLLTVISGRAQNKPCVVILKLEKEEGARAHLEEVEGALTFTIEHLRDLMLTANTRVFKASLFRVGSDDIIDGLVSDDQRGHRPRTEVADFFLGTFLGCRLRDDPRIVTKRVFTATESFFNEQVQDPTRRTRYQMALLVEMQSQRTTFDPRSFAQTHLQGHDRAAYLAYLQGGNLPARSFDRDTELITKQLRQMEMLFESGLRLSGPAAAIESRVKVAGEGNQTVVTIRDDLKSVRGK
jgi:hypothetical protein